MADARIGLDEPSTIDLYLDCESLTVGGNTVYRERVQIAGAADTDIAPVSGTDGLLVNLGSNNDVTVSGVATAADQSTIIGHLDGVEGLLTTIDADTGSLAGCVGGTELQVDVVGALPAGTNNIGDVDIASIAAGDNNIGNVDIASAIPAGTNNIGDVDVLTEVSSSFDHISNRDVDTTAEQLTATSITAKFGVEVKADRTNSGIVYVGNSDVTAGTTAATDGFPLSPGESVLVKVDNANKVYVIGSANNQIVYGMIV